MVACECLHVGNMFLKVLPSGVTPLHENLGLRTYYI